MALLKVPLSWLERKILAEPVKQALSWLERKILAEPVERATASGLRNLDRILAEAKSTFASLEAEAALEFTELVYYQPTTEAKLALADPPKQERVTGGKAWLILIYKPPTARR
jgi:hypothetical protein